MQSSRRWLAAGWMIALGCAPLAAHAGKPAPTGEPVDGVVLHPLQIGTPSSAPSVCRIGETAPPLYSLQYIFPPNDRYYTFMDPAQCTGCSDGIVQLTQAHVALHFYVPCTMPVTVGVVAAGYNGTCPYPLLDQVLCEPVAYDIVSLADVDYPYDVVLPMPAGCCIDRPAFLVVNFISSGSCNFMPDLMASGYCYPCRTWNIFTGGLGEMCSTWTYFHRPFGNFIMNAEAQCCLATGARRRTWGTVKTLYR